MKYAVLYKSGIWNAVEFATKREAMEWAAKYCPYTQHKVVPR